MKWTQKRKLAVLMIFHLLLGLFLWFSISKYGLGISTDSVHLLFASLNLSRGNGLFSFDGSFVSLWPPLYPMLLALIQLVSAIRSICFGHHSASHLFYRYFALSFHSLFENLPRKLFPCLGGQYSFGYWRGCSDHPSMASVRIICISSSSFFLFCWPAITWKPNHRASF